MIAVASGVILRQWWIARVWRHFFRWWELRINPDLLAQEAETNRVMAIVNKILP